jgi:geranylgeranylglycerol-phosphate geranylgeranyltransferase
VNPVTVNAGTGKAKAYLMLLRPGNCLMGAAGALLAAVICAGLSGVEEALVDVVLSMLVVIMFTGAGNALNDYFDRETDKVAHPERPLPKGLIAPKVALYLSAVFFGATLVLSLLVNLWSFAIVVTSIVVMVGYEVLLKAEGLAGNLAISWLTGALFLFGGAAVERMEVAWILALLAFLATLGREVVKDIQDMEGDRGTRLTLPMRVGRGRAGILASVAFLGAVALSPAPYLLDLLSFVYVPTVVVADGIFIYCALIHFADPERGQRIAKVAMLVSLVAFLLGGVL